MTHLGRYLDPEFFPVLCDNEDYPVKTLKNFSKCLMFSGCSLSVIEDPEYADIFVDSLEQLVGCVVEANPRTSMYSILRYSR